MPALVRLATSGRPVVAIDGCALACVRSSLARHGVTPSLHYDLSALGVKKRFKTDYDPEQAESLLGQIAADVETHGSIAVAAAG